MTHANGSSGTNGINGGLVIDSRSLPRALTSTSTSFPKNHKKLSSAEDLPYIIDNEFRFSNATTFNDMHDPATNNLITRAPYMTAKELFAVIASAKKAFLAWRDTFVAEAAYAGPEYIKGAVLEPLGVVTAICPFNFPVMIPLWSLPVVVITGNSLIIKASERDPGACVILMELTKKAGFPDGVVNMVLGAYNTVNFLLNKPEIKAISFIGNNKASEYIYIRASINGKRRCMALSVLVIVGETIDWIPDLIERARKIRADGGFESGADLGPDGAKVVLDGRRYFPPKYPNGNWVGPTVISGVNPSMECYEEEIFGPVLVVVSVDNLDDAIALINKNEYGNGMVIFTGSGSAAERFRRNIEAVSLPMFYFIGNKKSVAGGGGHMFYG
ncbi:aldehyde dehydrogenase [Fusarium solani]|uniref:Aldehyde dehydrogenase n=1 Tax=Fusarium solani TaxID=169388 RepID=A0A9P9GK39_FUSSL|nr:aldehyde dehydrogenase [Fusarium solani]KAH7240396.1 aldehyde dehydrogenase [Fusarium solani]